MNFFLHASDIFDVRAYSTKPFLIFVFFKFMNQLIVSLRSLLFFSRHLIKKKFSYKYFSPANSYCKFAIPSYFRICSEMVSPHMAVISLHIINLYCLLCVRIFSIAALTLTPPLKCGWLSWSLYSCESEIV